ncbi:hypothetical protein F5Y02DRAFT_345457 [Annulohypoxylon stygium]|nr:hypothetical protein F5Y02DRAFT_345457 [Annulohypoxylon stygium]
MTRYNRGVAGEKAAVREAQREAARQLDEEACRRRPSLGELDTYFGTNISKWSPGEFIIKAPPPQARCVRFVRQRPDMLPLKTDSCLDMAPIKKGSFFFMSVNYREEVDDWFEFDEEQQGATF